MKCREAVKHLTLGKLLCNNPFQNKATFVNFFYEGHDFLASMLVKVKY